MFIEHDILTSDYTKYIPNLKFLAIANLEL